MGKEKERGKEVTRQMGGRLEGGEGKKKRGWKERAKEERRRDGEI